MELTQEQYHEGRKLEIALTDAHHKKVGDFDEMLLEIKSNPELQQAFKDAGLWDLIETCLRDDDAHTKASNAWLTWVSQHG